MVLSVEQRQQQLETISLFSGLPADEFRQLAEATEAEVYEAQGTVADAGAVIQYLYVVLTGELQLTDANGDKVDSRGEGETFGEIAIIDPEPLRLSARAAAGTRLLRIPATSVRDAARSNEGVAQALVRAAIGRVRMALQSLRPERGIVDQVVKDWMSAPAQTAESDVTIQDAARRMNDHRISALLIQNEGRWAILTDRDLRGRVVAENRPTSDLAHSVATPDPVMLGSDRSLAEAMTVMAESNVHHLPIMDSDEVVGMLSASDVARAQDANGADLVRDIERAHDEESVVRLCQRRSQVFQQLVGSGASGGHIGRMMTAITDAATRRLLALAADELGAAPCPWSWIVFGSQSRREQALKTDQDNGMIIADAELVDHEYFDVLARTVNHGLDRCGFVLCPGDVMAMNPRWRNSLDGWMRQFDEWIAAPDPKPLMHASIFFDFRHLSGPRQHGSALAEHIRQGCMDNTRFLRFFAENALRESPPLGMFRRWRTEASDEGAGIDIKRRGISPITSLVRVRALARGVEQASTRSRIAALIQLEPHRRRDLASLLDAFDFVDRLRLQLHARCSSEGKPLSNVLPLGELSSLVESQLKDAFSVVQISQQVLARRYLLG